MPSLAPGVVQIASHGVNAFLVDGDEGLTLVDVGFAKAPGVLLAALAEHGRSPSDLRRIVLTHAHPDHVVGAPELRRRTHAAILIHAGDAPWLSVGRVPPEGRAGLLGHVIDRLPMTHWEPFQADGTVGDGDLLDGVLRVVHTPGHSPGHIVLVHEPSGTALIGDALFNRGKLMLGPAAMASDPAARPAALARIPSDVRAIGFAHGTPLTGDGVEAFHRFVAAY